MRGRGHELVALTEPRAPRPSLPKYRIKENAMRHRGGAKLPTRDSLMHHPAGSPWCSPVAQSGGTEVQVLTQEDTTTIDVSIVLEHALSFNASICHKLS